MTAIRKGRWQTLQHLAILLTETGQIEHLRDLIFQNSKSFTGEQLRTIANGLFPMHPAAAALQSVLGELPDMLKDGPLGQPGQKEFWPAAEILLRAAIQAGDRYSSFRLGLLLTQDGSRAAEAGAAYRDAIAAGVTPAYSALGNLLTHNAARLSEAEAVYREGVKANDKGSFAALILILARTPGRQEDLNEIATLAVQRGIVKLPPS
jgi:hypothetical protein